MKDLVPLFVSIAVSHGPYLEGSAPANGELGTLQNPDTTIIDLTHKINMTESRAQQGESVRTDHTRIVSASRPW